MWIDENICYINTTDISKLSVENLEFEGKQTCSVDVFDDGEFNEHHFDLEIKQCFDIPCTHTIDDNLFENVTILNGTSVSCHQSNQFGIITKSKLLNPLKSLTSNFKAFEIYFITEQYEIFISRS